MPMVRRWVRSWKVMSAVVAFAAVAGAVLLGALPVSARDNSHVEGTYSLAAKSSIDQHTFTVAAGLSAGGVITAIVSDDPATELGEWGFDSYHNVVATFYAFEVGPNGPEGTVTIHIKARVRGETMSGTYIAAG